MSLVVHESSDVVLGHFRELFLENTFETSENDVAFPRVIIVHNSELNDTVLLFNNCRLLGKCDDLG